nr:immunoglobulin light chain junction region [Macaca mulatta]MOV78962.1 immunoglobulin light chain junction region [Macaca mulatta]MOV80262.1 immunoglobulin light chain junction region [Macaca mulatta]MOV81360.1 immunoglobulin light chain junction region [Macaca mulatta]MOV83909.1 immunoglobulin light chain junction region [Macaca mulatta]
CLQDIQFPLTF